MNNVPLLSLPQCCAWLCVPVLYYCPESTSDVPSSTTLVS